MQLMNWALHPLIKKFVIVYFDNFLIYIKQENDYLDYLRQVLEVLHENEFYINLKKCSFLTVSVIFLGLLVGVEGILVDEDKV